MQAQGNNGFDCCIAICGCGDDLLADSDILRKAVAQADDGENSKGWFHGFQTKGVFKNADILSVHRASAEDPTASGQLGTETLRASKDPFNAGTTFSVVFRRRVLGRAVGVATLDIECATEEEYWLLVHGFSLMKAKCDKAAAAEAETAATEQLPAFATDALKQVEALWTTGRAFVAAKAQKEPEDPVMKLFEPSSLDPWRMLWLGSRGAGGLGKGAMRLPPSRFLGWASAGTQIWARLHMAGLAVKCVYSWDLSKIILKVRCPEWRLEEMAEKMHLKLRRHDGSMRRFKISHRDCFPEKSNGSLFSSGDRQHIIDHIVKSKIRDGGAELDENTPLGEHIVQSFPLHKEAALESLRHSWVTFWKTEQVGEIPRPWSIYSTPWRETLYRLLAGTSGMWNKALSQPLDQISEYYGEGVGFLYAYTAFYTRWLITPSIFGFIVFVFQLKERRLDHWLCLPYAVFIMVWVSFMLAYWRQKQSALAYRWGVLDYEIEETERPQFRGEPVYDETTGEVRKVFPAWKRSLRYMVSVPLLGVLIVLILSIMVTIFSTQDRLLSEYASGIRSFDFSPIASGGPIHTAASLTLNQSSLHHLAALPTPSNTTSSAPINFSFSAAGDPTFWVIAIFYPSLYGIVIYLSATIVDFLSIKLNAFENHRTQSTYLNRLILKVFSFRFIAVFTNLYFYTFNPNQNAGNSYIRVALMVFCLLTVGTWGEAFMDACLPSLYQRVMMYRQRHHVSSANRMLYRAKEHDDAQGNAKADLIGRKELYIEQARSKVWEQANQVSYTTYSAYASLVIQLGLIIFFSAIFPLAPLIAFANNVFMLRLHAYKICFTMQRPLSQKSSGMGVWEDVLQIMSVIGVLTNLALFGFTSEVLRENLQVLGSVGIAVLLFVFEHVMLFFKYWLYTSVPRVPARIHRLIGYDRASLSKHKDEKRKTKFGRATMQGGFKSPDTDAEGAVPLLAPLDELNDQSQFIDIDLDPQVAGGRPTEMTRGNSDDDKSDSPLLVRRERFSTRHGLGSPSKVDRRLSTERLANMENQLPTRDARSDSESSLDTSDSDNYELARSSRPSRSALAEIKNSPDEKRTRDSIATRLKKFQIRRQEMDNQMVHTRPALDQMDGVPSYELTSTATPLPSRTEELEEEPPVARDLPPLSRKSIMAMLGWRVEAAVDAEPENNINAIAPVSTDSKLETAERLSAPAPQRTIRQLNAGTVTPSTGSRASAPTKLEAVKSPVKSPPAVVKGPSVAMKTPVKEASVVKTTSAIKTTPVVKAPLTARKDATSPPTSSKRVVPRKVVVRSPSPEDPRAAIRKKLADAKRDQISVKATTAKPRDTANNPFSFVAELPPL